MHLLSQLAKDVIHWSIPCKLRLINQSKREVYTVHFIMTDHFFLHFRDNDFISSGTWIKKARIPNRRLPRKVPRHTNNQLLQASINMTPENT